MDIHKAASHVLSVARDGASISRIMALSSQMSVEEIRWLLRILEERRLLETGESSTYWTTVDGIKFLEIQDNMEHMLQTQRSLV